MSRYDSTSSGESFISRDENLARLAARGLEGLNPEGRSQVGLDLRHERERARLGSDRHLRNRHLERLLGFRTLLPNVEQDVGRPIVRRLIGLSRSIRVIRKMRLDLV